MWGCVSLCPSLPLRLESEGLRVWLRLSLSFCLAVSLSLCLSLCLSVSLSLCVSVPLSLCLSVFPSFSETEKRGFYSPANL